GASIWQGLESCFALYERLRRASPLVCQARSRCGDNDFLEGLRPDVLDWPNPNPWGYAPGGCTAASSAHLPVWSKISNALKRLGFRSHNFHTRLLSETLNSIYNPGSTIKFTEALE